MSYHDPDLVLSTGFENSSLTKDVHAAAHNEERGQINGLTKAVGPLSDEDPTVADRLNAVEQLLDGVGGDVSVTQAPAFAPVAGSTKLIPPSGFKPGTVTTRTLTASDKNVGYFAVYDLPAGTVIPGIPDAIQTGAGGGGSTTSVLTGTNSDFETTVGILTANTNAQAPVVVTTWAHGGTHSVRCRSTAAGKFKYRFGGGAGALNNRPTCAPADTFTPAAYFRAATVGRPIRWYADYFNSSHAYLGTVSGSASVTDLTSGTGTLLTDVFTVPTTIGGGTPASVAFGPEFNSTAIGASEDHYMDDATITKNAGSGGSSGAVFRRALYEVDEHGEILAAVPLAVTGPTDATIAGTSPNAFPAGPYVLPRNMRVAAVRVYQYPGSAPSPHPTVYECQVARYVPTVAAADATAGTKMGWSQTGLTGSLTAVVGAPDGETDNIPFMPLGTVSASGGGGGGGGGSGIGTGQVMFGLSKKHASGQLKTTISALEVTLGRYSTASRVYYDWNQSSLFPSTDDTNYMTTAFNGRTGRVLAVTTATSNGSGASKVFVPWADIAAGIYDAQISAWAAKLASVGSTVYWTMQHEPDSGDREQTGADGGAANYIAAWQRCWGIIHPAASNVKFLFGPTAFGYSTGKAQKFYPGDGYVDCIGADGYNWSDTRPGGGSWKTFAETFEAFLQFCDLHPTVPEIGLPEWGSARDHLTDPRTRPGWISEALTAVKSDPRWSRLKLAIYWDNHDNAFIGGAYKSPRADFRFETMPQTDPNVPNGTADTASIAAMLSFASDSVMV